MCSQIDKYLAENDAVEWFVKSDGHFHVPFAAHDFQVHDVGHVFGTLTLPKIQAITVGRRSA